MHIGKQCVECPELNTSIQEKYLGDIITSDGKQDKNILSRISRAWSYLAEIKALGKEKQKLA